MDDDKQNKCYICGQSRGEVHLSLFLVIKRRGEVRYPHQPETFPLELYLFPAYPRLQKRN